MYVGSASLQKAVFPENQSKFYSYYYIIAIDPNDLRVLIGNHIISNPFSKHMMYVEDLEYL